MKVRLLTLLLLTGVLTGAGLPGPAWEEIVDDEMVYGQPRAEVFRQHRVKEVFVDHEAFREGRTATARHLNVYQLFDREGRLVRQERAHDRVLSSRTDWEYNAKGQAVTGTSYQAIGARQDTGRAGLAWLPAEHTRFVAEGTEPAGRTRWNAESGLWDPIARIRTWTRHDTTYTETRDAQGTVTELERQFAIGAGTNTQRTDNLTFTNGRPREPRFTYYRLHKKRLMEAGAVTFEKEIQEYVEKHPETLGYVLGKSKSGFYALNYHVAGLKPGTLTPGVKLLYNGKGQLLVATGYGARTAYQRGAAGRLSSSALIPEEGRGGSVTAYFYRKDGLLERETITRTDGTDDETRYYRYRFY